jgi:hypothetical protein
MPIDKDVPNLGIVRPPLVYLASILLGSLLQVAAPLPFLPRTIVVPLGASLVVIAIALFASAVSKFRAAGTPVPARKPTTAIVRTGPYRFSRNPISRVLPASARYRDLGQQPVAAGHADRRGRAHALHRHPERGAVPGAKIRESVSGVQSVGAPLAVARLVVNRDAALFDRTRLPEPR